jgi:hypothetical protein
MNTPLSRVDGNETSETILLVRHPAPYPTESLYGYLLRLSEANGYQNMTPMMRLAGMKGWESRKLGMKLTSIASIANCSAEQLETIAHSDPDKSYARLAGHKVLAGHLRRQSPTICPDCLDERGYIEAQCELLAMTGCPIHKRALLSFCNCCGKRLTWFRRGLLVCSCGAILTNVGLATLPPEEVDLLDVIRSSVLGLPVGTENSSRLPTSDLRRMDLYPLLTLIRVLGSNYNAIRRTGDQNDPSSDTACAAKVLCDWPNGLLNLLDAMKALDPAKGFVQRNLRGLYYSLFKSRAIPDRTQVKFAKRVFADFASKHWGNGVVVKRLLQPYDVIDPEHYITPRALAKRLNIHQHTVETRIQAGTIPHLNINIAGVDRPFIDSRAININPRLPGKLLLVRKAAAEIGISVPLLKVLRDLGVFEARSAPMFYHGFHELDVQGFIGCIRSTACLATVNTEPDQYLTVRRALHELRHSLEAQVFLIKSILTCQTKVIGSNSTAVPDLRIPDAQFQSVLANEMPLWYRETLTSRDAACRLGCSSEYVLAMAKHGYLDREQTPIGMRITLKSAVDFAEEFVSLAAIATANRTSARALIKSCQIHGVFMCTIKSTHFNTSFVRREDAGLIAQLRQVDGRRKPGGMGRPERN